jgi:SAM-dependent methyltransferase
MENDITDTAHIAWEKRWQDQENRTQWSEPEPDVLAVVDELKQRGLNRVLDLGCGVGRHSLLFAAMGFSVTALDASETGVNFTREAARKAGCHVDVSHGSMTKLPYPDHSMDYVLAWNVIYHGDERIVRCCIGEIRRVLRPGGLYQGTMLSKRNVYYGEGREISPNTFVGGASLDKEHPHFYCSGPELLRLFGGFDLLSIVEREHDETGSYHWHVLAKQAES